MPIVKDHSTIPFPQRAEDRSPVKNPIVVPVLAEKWLAKYQADNELEKPKAIADRRFRASWASKRCDRSLGYALTDTPVSEPLTLADYWRFGLGTMVHEYVQEAFTDLFPGVRSEVAVDLKEIGLDGAATVDMVLPAATPADRPIVVEIKTINGFGFKKAATAFKGPAEGPRWSAIVQGALAAAALGADLIVAYLSLENLSPNIALSYGDGTTVGHFAAEWHYRYEQAHEIATAEVLRINRVLNMVDSDILPPRALHDPEVRSGATVFDPSRGSWSVVNNGTIVDSGRTWMCDYCSHREQCIKDGEGGASGRPEF